MKKILAIDFGTTHSYFTICPEEETKPEAIDFGSPSQHGLETAVLYRKGTKFLVGNTAFQEYGIALPEERNCYKICMQFKPDICDSEEAYKNAYDFFSGVLSLRPDLLANVSQVFIGVPCEASSEFRQKVKEIVQKAGYGENIITKEEPKGALIYHVYNGDISPEQGLGNVLVVDFGGGTCDFAFMQNGRPLYAWGDMELGGRLFDDLFFQWFLDENPKMLEQIQRQNEEYYVLFYESRKAKEHFSDFMRQTKTQGKASALIGNYGVIRDMTWSEFLERARNYKPSAVFLKWMEMTKSNYNLYQKTLKNQTVDLIKWFKDKLAEGIRQYGIQDKIELVILAGGSSQWIWVSEIVKEQFGNIRIIQSNRPYAVISEGLSLFPALQRKHKQVQKELKKEKEKFIKKQLIPEVKKIINDFVSDTAKSVSIEVYDRIFPVLKEFREKGGTINALTTQLASSIKDAQPSIEGKLREKTEPFSKQLSVKTTQRIRDWFKEYDLFISEVEIKDLTIKDVNISNSVELGFTVFDWIMAITITIITACVCGGADMALIASGPIGLLIGGLIGICAKKGADKIGAMDAAKWVIKKLIKFESVKSTLVSIEEHIPLRLAGFVLTEKRMKSLQNDLEKHIREEIKKKLKDKENEIENFLTKHIDMAIEALSEINQV